MTAVNAETKQTTTVRRPETGWATARRLHGQCIRTCERATFDGDDGPKRRGDEWNVVRGED
ncbi:hypothetical protein ACHBTE_19760 [Streptomyces sp. M41]|uniref:hypothetical protein n=1 Tax=Streptomyces sp. M41 TaxID=3059412 RepID=UPI00374DB96E